MLVYGHAVASEVAYNENMDGTIARLLRRLGAVPPATGRDAALAVDGVWWDSTVALPAKQLVRRRAFEIGPTVTPWLVTEAPASNHAKQRVAEVCAGNDRPITLHNPDACADGSMHSTPWRPRDGERGDRRARLPFPRPGDHRITQADFLAIIATIQVANKAESA
jgi:hypothetical protein